MKVSQYPVNRVPLGRNSEQRRAENQRPARQPSRHCRHLAGGQHRQAVFNVDNYKEYLSFRPTPRCNVVTYIYDLVKGRRKIAAWLKPGGIDRMRDELQQKVEIAGISY